MPPLRQRLGGILLAILILLAGTPILPAAPALKPLRPPTPPAGDSLFTALTPAQSRIDFVNPIDTKHPLKHIYRRSP